jgi:hypothetical protein
VPDLHVVEEVGVGAADALVGADERFALDDQLLADLDRHPAGAVDVGDLPEADLGPAQVAEHGNRVVEPLGRLADQVEHGLVAVERPVREVEPAHVHAGVEQAVQHLDVRGGWTHRGDNFGADHACVPRLARGEATASAGERKGGSNPRRAVPEFVVPLFPVHGLAAGQRPCASRRIQRCRSRAGRCRAAAATPEVTPSSSLPARAAAPA